MTTTLSHDSMMNLPLGQIAVSLPGSTAIFRKLKLDFCCGGQISLADACEQKGLDVQRVASELEMLVRSDAMPAVQDANQLIDHILHRYHEVHRQQLPELIRMARRVEAVHREHPLVPVGLADLLEEMEQELLDHMAKEEHILFPMLREGDPIATHPIRVMRHEHFSHGEQVEKLAAMTNDHTPPSDACNTWRALYAGIAQLTDDLIHHIHLENNVLFPMFEPAAPASASQPTAAPCCSSGTCG